MLLELGAGGNPTEGFEHADARPLPHIEYVFDLVKDVYPFPKGSVKHLLMHQTLEHFSRQQAIFILHECRSILDIGGTIQISVPNIEGWMKAALSEQISWHDSMERLYGGQDYEYNFHKWGYSERSLRELLLSTGFKNLDFSGTCWTDIHVKGYR